MNIPKAIHPTWHEHLQPLFDDSKMAMLFQDVTRDRFYPEKEYVFRVFHMPFDKVRVVILGQDPYPRKGQANGLSFAVNEDIPMPASLKIIQKEMIREWDTDILTEVSNIGEKWKTLEHWWHQGVFLLNSALTVKQGEPGSHVEIWRWFTREVIRMISIYGNPIWLMWGSKARAYTGYIHGYYKWNGNFVDDKYNYVLETDHPAAETYPGNKGSFTGCNHFKISNDILKLKNQSPIIW